MKQLIIIFLCISQISVAQKNKIDDSLFLLSKGNLNNDYIKISYLGNANHFIPSIYIENSYECNTSFGQCELSANYIFHMGFHAFIFKFNNDTYPKIKNLIVESNTLSKQKAKVLDIQIKFKTNDTINIIHVSSFNYIKILEKKIRFLKISTFLWLVPALNEFHFYSTGCLP